MDDKSKKPSEYFKSCPCCGVTWENRSAFLADSGIELIGYQIHFQELQLGLLMFDHTKCQTTMAFKVKDFHDLCPGPEFADRKTNTEECPKYCFHENNFLPCPMKCECTYVRNLIQILRNVKTSLTPF